MKLVNIVLRLITIHLIPILMSLEISFGFFLFFSWVTFSLYAVIMISAEMLLRWVVGGDIDKNYVVSFITVAFKNYDEEGIFTNRMNCHMVMSMIHRLEK